VVFSLVCGQPVTGGVAGCPDPRFSGANCPNV
jgi:hypothetical protein